MQVDLLKYKEFVEAVTSKESNNLTALSDRLLQLHHNLMPDKDGYLENGPKINVPLLLTAGLGLGSEGGEFQEIIKKIFFQGKPLNEENVFHMKRELGDIIFYWINACRALNLDPNDVIQENVTKLSARYPKGFSVDRSENREKGDI
jgi:NTP pyrophosphatase (non-canonical NTP hydrolase)